MPRTRRARSLSRTGIGRPEMLGVGRRVGQDALGHGTGRGVILAVQVVEDLVLTVREPGQVFVPHVPVRGRAVPAERTPRPSDNVRPVRGPDRLERGGRVLGRVAGRVDEVLLEPAVADFGVEKPGVIDVSLDYGE